MPGRRKRPNQEQQGILTLEAPFAGPDFHLEQSFDGPVCGVDEVGRGPWAGPVVTAAVILDLQNIPNGLDDSKKLNAKKREALAMDIFAHATVSLSAASVWEIGQRNILGATMWAMVKAVKGLPVQPVAALIDGNRIPEGLTIPAQAVIKGDGRSLSIAAASIVAKVTRDRLMKRLALRYPQYGWDSNSGYGVKHHQAALNQYGVSVHHRTTFTPIRKLLIQNKS